MGLKYGTVDVTAVYYNGSEVEELYYGSTKVFEKVAQQTATPSIPSFAYLNGWRINITNNDAGSADMWAEANDSTPDILRVTGLGSGQTYQVVDTSQPSFATFTYYCTAQASGKTLSNVVSRTIT